MPHYEVGTLAVDGLGVTYSEHGTGLVVEQMTDNAKTVRPICF